MVDRLYLLSPVTSSLAETRRKAMSSWDFSLLSHTFKPVREESSDRVIDRRWNHCKGGQMLRHPQNNVRSLPHLSEPCEKKAKSVIMWYL